MSINKYNSTLLKFKVQPNADTYLIICLLVGLENENEGIRMKHMFTSQNII